MKATGHYIFEKDGFFTTSDKKALITSLQEKKMGKTEIRIVLHGRTRLSVDRFDTNQYRVNKAVNKGMTYLYSCYFLEYI